MKKCRMTLEEFKTNFLPEEFPVLLVCDGDVTEYKISQFPEKYLTRNVLFISASDSGKILVFLKNETVRY